MKDTTPAGETTRKGRKIYSFAKQQARRNRRREEAEKRQFEHGKLTTAQKLRLAQSPKRRGESKREIARLTKLLGVAVTPPPVPVAAPVVPAVAPVAKRKRAKRTTATAG